MAKSYNICLDVGGTKVLGAIFNEKDEIIYRLKKRSKDSGEGAADVEKVIVSVVEEMIRESGIDRGKLNAIASCAPGVIDQEHGIVLFTPNLPWRDYDMRAAMEKRFQVPFFVGNDVNLGVLGEYKFGAARGYKNVVGFFVGTGMGGGLILNGELYTGNQFKAAEYGHMILEPEGPLCGCGQRGCLEAFSSKKGMSAYIREQAARGRKSSLVEAVQDGVFRSKKLKKALEAGDTVAIVDRDGTVRYTSIGRCKVEKRPMIMIEATDGRKSYSTILQNAETVKVVTEDGAVSATKLSPGDRVLARLEEGGRHFGMKIDETISEL